MAPGHLVTAISAVIAFGFFVSCTFAQDGNKLLETFTSKADAYRNWSAPIKLQTKHAYYMSGKDAEGLPIWVVEWGRWDVRGIVESGEEVVYDKYLEQLAVNVVSSIRPEDGEGDWNRVKAIVDLQDFNLRQMTSLPTLTYILRKFRQYEPVLKEILEEAIVINMNYVAHNMVTLIRPVLGQIVERIEFYGANKNSWLPKLIEMFPRDQIPEWYGGNNRKYKPIAVFG